MRINRIVQLRKCRIFRDFTWPDELSEFSRFNLFYGWNGSGKTTLSRILSDLQDRRTPSDGDVVLSLEGKEITGADFKHATIPVRVFNRDFVTENVFRVVDGDLPPILILGEENIEKEKRLEGLRVQLADLEGSLLTAQKEREKAEDLLDKHCRDKSRQMKGMLRSTGENRYNNYDKGDYKKRALEMLVIGDSKDHRLTESDEIGLKTQLGEAPKHSISEFVYQEPDFDGFGKQAANLLSTTVVSETIQSLRIDVEATEWVQQGYSLHKKRCAAECLFCNQPLLGQRLSDLERHFNVAYEDFINELEIGKAEIGLALESLSDLKVPHKAEFYQQLIWEFEPISSELSLYCNQAENYLNFLVEELSQKKDRAFESIPLKNGGFALPNGQVLDHLKGIILKHNQMCREHSHNSKEAREKLESNLVSKELQEFQNLRASVDEHLANVETKTAKAKKIGTEISNLEDDITEHGKPAEELNKDFREYMGHAELQLEITDKGYALTRNGYPARQPSEGEITAIALLYFLQTLRDRRFGFKQGVVMLDDPISSLDANSLYQAFGFIQERTKCAGQLFILTHNFTFFSLVRNWFRHLKGQRSKNIDNQPARFYMLNCLIDGNSRYSRIQVLDPLLKYYESDYHYLFACVVRNALYPNSSLEVNYGLPNMARRLLEAFLAHRQPEVSGNLTQKMLNVNFEEAKKIQILRFVHTYSHGDAIAKPEHDPTLLGGVSKVLTYLLELIKSEDVVHYEGMLKAVNPEIASENGR